jgi:hypothetical protein
MRTGAEQITVECISVKGDVARGQCAARQFRPDDDLPEDQRDNR